MYSRKSIKALVDDMERAAVKLTDPLDPGACWSWIESLTPRPA